MYAAALMAPHPEPGSPGGGLVRADTLEAPARRRQLDDRRHDSGGGDGEIDRRRDAEPEPSPEIRQAMGGRRRDARRVPEHGAEEQRVRAERRDDRVESHPPYQPPVQTAGGEGGEERETDRREEPCVVPGGILGEDHDVERQPAGNREVDAALHDDERLAQRRDRERRGERQHREERAPRDARRREQETRRKKCACRDKDGRKAARQEAPRSPRDSGPRLQLTRDLSWGVTSAAECNAEATVHKQ